MHAQTNREGWFIATRQTPPEHLRCGSSPRFHGHRISLPPSLAIAVGKRWVPLYSVPKGQCPLFMAHESAHARRIAATATSLAALAAVATGGLLWGAARSGHARAITTTERIPDEGEDFFTAVEQPHKIYEFPWLRDQKFQYEARLLGYGPSETWDRQRNGHTSHDAYMGFNEGYKRTAYDEYGDRAFDVDMRPAQGCYDDDSWDCYREQFDPDTGYLRPSA